jgi:hypothetical protein
VKTLNSTVNLGNGNRWRVLDADPIESLAAIRITWQFISNGAAEIARCETYVRNGMSDRVTIDTNAQILARALLVEGQVVSTPTGYTDLFGALRAAANTMTARRDAAETWLLSAGVAGANMAGT